MSILRDQEKKKILDFINKHDELFDNEEYDHIFKIFPYNEARVEDLYRALNDAGINILDHMSYIPYSYFCRYVVGTNLRDIILPKNLEKAEPYSFYRIDIDTLTIDNPNFSFNRGYTFYGCWPQEFIWPNNGLPSAKKRVESAALNSGMPIADGTICTGRDGKAKYNASSKSWENID